MTRSALRAASYFKERPCDRILRALRDRYVDLGRVGGNAMIENPTREELASVRDFFGSSQRVDGQGRLKVSLAHFEEQLQISAFACTLPEFLETYFDGPVVTKDERKTEKECGFRAFLSRMQGSFPSGAAAVWWRGVCGGVVSDGDDQEEVQGTRRIVRREWDHGDTSALEVALHRVGQALAALPRAPGTTGRVGKRRPTKVPGGREKRDAGSAGRDSRKHMRKRAGEPDDVRLAVFAGKVTGDPHAFDAGTLAARLLERALMDLHPEPGDLLVGLESATLQRDAILHSAGLLRDDISSTVLVWGLCARLGVRSSARIPRRVSVHLPLREVERLERLRVPSGVVHIVENPSVFAEIIDALETSGGRSNLFTRPLPTVVCTGGQLSLAGVKLLERFETAGASLYYSGDFDEPGLAIAASVLRRFPKVCRPWRLSVDDYLAACERGNGGLPFDSTEENRLAQHRDAFPELVDAMTAKGRKAFQEAIVDRMVGDCLGRPRRG